MGKQLLRNEWSHNTGRCWKQAWTYATLLKVCSGAVISAMIRLCIAHTNKPKLSPERIYQLPPLTGELTCTGCTRGRPLNTFFAQKERPLSDTAVLRSTVALLARAKAAIFAQSVLLCVLWLRVGARGRWGVRP